MYVTYARFMASPDRHPAGPAAGTTATTCAGPDGQARAAGPYG